MKNVFLIPTEKPSRLFLNKVNNKLLLDSDTYCDLIRILPSSNYQNIYITSDEEINQQTEPCWCINTIKNTWDADLIYYQGSMPQYHYVGFKKIIITTDQDLIADGVQAIDDEFLEWFVKNPSCEYVEVNDSKVVKEHIFDGSNDGEIVWEKKITIPQKEAKQETLTYTESAKKEERIFNSTMMSKQETLEEVSIKISEQFDNQRFKSGVYFGVKEGAKWQQERSYSEEEVEDIINSFEKLCYNYQNNKDWFPAKKSEWFEKFKKK
jgi:hypothetical protein